MLLLGVLWFLLDNVDFCLAELVRLTRPGALWFASAAIGPNPIGREKMSSYGEMCEIVRRNFDVIDSALFYSPADLKSGRPLAEAGTDLLLIAHRRER